MIEPVEPHGRIEMPLEDALVLTRAHRWLAFLFGAMLLELCCGCAARDYITLQVVFAILLSVIHLAAFVTVVRAVRVTDGSTAEGVFLGILALVPWLSLLVVLSVRARARTALQNAGVDPGFLWLSDRAIRTAYADRNCIRCGYDRRGPHTGACPECGEPLRTASSFAPPPP